MAEAGRNMAPDICLLKVGTWRLAIARTPVDKAIIGKAYYTGAIDLKEAIEVAK